jgi:uncharacterized protein (TIGR02453 family)
MAKTKTRTIEAAGTRDEPRFRGFPAGGNMFWVELAKNMNKPWFDANKARYERLWAAPMHALLAALHPELQRAYGKLPIDPGKVLRIHRDQRFSKDKTPYKTNIGATMQVGGQSFREGGCSALYVHLGLDEQFIGAGMYMFSPGQLAAWRAAIAGKPGAQLASLVKTLRAQGHEVSGHDDYKSVPRGYSADHPRAELLKMRGLTVVFPRINGRELASPAVLSTIVARAVEVVPLVKWLHKHTVMSVDAGTKRGDA